MQSVIIFVSMEQCKQSNILSPFKMADALCMHYLLHSGVFSLLALPTKKKESVIS